LLPEAEEEKSNPTREQKTRGKKGMGSKPWLFIQQGEENAEKDPIAFTKRGGSATLHDSGEMIAGEITSFPKRRCDIRFRRGKETMKLSSTTKKKGRIGVQGKRKNMFTCGIEFVHTPLKRKEPAGAKGGFGKKSFSI